MVFFFLLNSSISAGGIPTLFRIERAHEVENATCDVGDDGDEDEDEEDALLPLLIFHTLNNARETRLNITALIEFYFSCEWKLGYITYSGLNVNVQIYTSLYLHRALS